LNEDKLYVLRKIAVMITCMLIIVTVGLGIISFQSKKVTINYYGNIIKVTTMSNTIEGLLMQNNIYIDEKAVVYPGVDNRIRNNMEIKIYSETEVAMLDIGEYRLEVANNIVEKKEEHVRYTDYASEKKSNATKARGTTSILKKGEKGQIIETYIVKYKNDKEIAKTLLNEKTIKEPVTQILEVGTNATMVSRSSEYRISEEDLIVDSGFKKYNIKLSTDLQKYTYNMCKKYKVEYEMMLALMRVESGYNTNSVGAGAYGLCQISGGNLSYLRRNIGTTNLMDPYQNIKAGTYWLSRYINSWSNEAKGEVLSLHALNSYNWGEGRYRQYLKKGNSATSWYYGKRVLAIRDKLIENGGL